MARQTNSLPLTDPYPKLVGSDSPVIVRTNHEPEGPDSDDEGGVLKIEQEDGSVIIDFNPRQTAKEDEEKGFYENLASKLSQGDLDKIATDLLEGIEIDKESRKEWLETRAMGIGLLGLRLEKPRSDAGSSSAPLEGMSTVRHPLLLEAVTSFQATARAELLPAQGPVKVRNDTPVAPKSEIKNRAQQEFADSLSGSDELSQALEKDLNHYLTAIATEYVPDTDRMLFYVGFGGDGFKKVYNCPLRRRPVSESIDAEDLIVSNAATDLHNAGRITHRIKMRFSTLRRMQILGAYRDVDLQEPQPAQKNPVDIKKEEIAGIKNTQQRPEDRDYEIYETYCELDLDEFAPKAFKGKGLPLPYRVTIESQSRQILDVRRNWNEDDTECLAKRYFVQFPFIRGLGFYGLGYIHLLGNTTNALTAAWRETLDSGMYSNFPGFLYAKGAGRQLTNQFRVPPGGGVPIDVGAQQSIRDTIMPLPYKDVGAGFSTFITHVEEVGRRLASTASINVGEGKQDAPVGTTLALIEQGTKVIDSAHKRLHASQAEEFKLLKERFKEDPEAFWRHNRRPSRQWQKEQFIEALNNCDLVPVADPNNPTSLHRLAKATAIKTLEQANPALYDPMAVDMRIMRIAGIDPEGLFRPEPAPPPPDPRMTAIQEKARAQETMAKLQLLETQIRAATAHDELANKAQDRMSRERIEAMKLQLQQLDVAQSQIQHAADEEKARARMLHEMNVKANLAAHNAKIDEIKSAQQASLDQISMKQDLAFSAAREIHQQRQNQMKHEADLRRADEAHAAKLKQSEDLNAAKVEATKAMAKVKKAAKPKPKKSKS